MDLSPISLILGVRYLFISFLDFGKIVDNVIFIIDIFLTEFKTAATTLGLAGNQVEYTRKIKFTISVMATVSSSSYRSIHSMTVGSRAILSSSSASDS